MAVNVAVPIEDLNRFLKSNNLPKPSKKPAVRNRKVDLAALATRVLEAGGTDKVGVRALEPGRDPMIP